MDLPCTTRYTALKTRPTPVASPEDSVCCTTPVKRRPLREIQALSSSNSYPGLDHYLQTLHRVPYYQYLGIEIRRYKRGEASARMRSNNLTGPLGVVDEGPLLTLGSLTTQVAIMTLLGAGRSVVSLEQRISLLRPTRANSLIAKAKVDHLRVRMAQGHFRIYDEEREVIASGSLIAHVLPREQVSEWHKSGTDWAVPSFPKIPEEDTDPKVVTLPFTSHFDDLE